MIARVLCLLLIGGALGAQTPKKAAAKPNPVRDDLRALWLQSSDYLAKSAAAVPESLYVFKPTPAVRSFGQIIGHVAGTQNLLCAVALGQKEPAEDAIEKSASTKAALVEALKQSVENCRKAYALSDAAMSGSVKVFGAPGTRRSALMLNATHNFEHYGNIITYLRIMGMVPPSSQGQ